MARKQTKRQLAALKGWATRRARMKNEEFWKRHDITWEAKGKQSFLRRLVKARLS